MNFHSQKLFKIWSTSLFQVLLLGVMRIDRIRNENTRTAQDRQFIDKERPNIGMEAAVCWEDAKDGTTIQEERKAKENVHGCSEGGHGDGWFDIRRCKG